MTVYIDADACPVRAEALRVAERHGLPVVVVSNGGIRPNPHPLVETVIVPEGPDTADDWIAARAGAGDICLTADLPLAARCLEAGARVLRFTGEPVTSQNIGQLLATRQLMSDLRGANPLGAEGGGRPLSKTDRSRLLDALDRLARSAVR